VPTYSDSAASRMISRVALGWESSGTWLDCSSNVLYVGPLSAHQIPPGQDFSPNLRLRSSA
jgi:hypothetical protein